MSLLHSNIIGDSGKELLVLHGFLGMSDNWKSQAQNFAAKGYRVHLIDQRNHGRSFWSDQFSYGELVKDLYNYVHHHNLKSVILLGHSMGGKTVMNFAAAYPDIAEKLIVADIAPKYYKPHHQSILEGLSSIDFDIIKSRKTADFQLEKYISDRPTRQFLLKNLYWITPEKLGFRMNIAVLKNCGEQLGAALDSEANYSKPTLFIIGENSNYVKQAIDGELILEHFPQSEIIGIPGAGHWLHAEQPKLFFDKVIGWLS